MNTTVTHGATVALKGISKRFGPNVALDDVTLTLEPGSVHALVGMNGSGKSTLVKILSGFYTPDAGQITVGSDHGASKRVAFVHQDLALIEDMTVLENFTLGRQVATRGGVIDWRTERARAVKILSRFALEHVVDERVDEISKSEATIVAIARAVATDDHDIAALVLDEPTSTLPTAETSRLLAVMRDCAADGLGVLFISHRLGEVKEVADTVTVLRNGRVVHAGAVADIDVAGIAAAMAGVEARAMAHLAEQTTMDSVSERDLRPAVEGRALTGHVVKELDITAHYGEVLGVVGLLGSGVEELGKLLSARTSPAAGTVTLDGEPLTPKVMQRVGFVPANRASQGSLRGLSARENGAVADLRRFLRGGRIDQRRERAVMKKAFEEMTVYPNDPELMMEGLSGGNQQKVIFARWLSTDVRVIVADEPTQGVDVHAKSQILSSLRERAAEGLAVILLSGEPEEIISACDRVVVVGAGKVRAEFVAPLRIEEVVSSMNEEY